MHQTSPSTLNHIVDIKDVIYSMEEVFRHTEKIRNAYEHLFVRYEKLSIENVELRSAKVTVNSPHTLGHKRRKTDESVSVINDSVMSNDPLNEAIQDISSCVEDEIIESTPKPDVTRKNVSKKNTIFKTPIKQNPIKAEKIDDSLVAKGLKTNEPLIDVQKIKVEKSPESPLRSVENQSLAGKENRQAKHSSKWITNAMVSPSRVDRSGFISAKSPRGKSRLSLSKPARQALLDFPKKSVKETTMDTCAETFFEGTPRKPILDSKNKFLRQQCLEACINSPKDSDDENVFLFKSTVVKSSPPTIKWEPQTGQIKDSGKVITEHNQSPCDASSSSSVVALSGERPQVIVIEESQPLFEDCTETFCEKLDLKMHTVELLMATDRRKSESDVFVANHNMSCKDCKSFMASNLKITMEQKLHMIDRCNSKSKRPDTDPEFWNPRILATPESQKQETLIDDRWATRKKKT